MSKYIIFAALALSCAITAQAVEQGKSQTLTSPDQVPEGLEKSDWQSIRQAYQAAKVRSAESTGVTTQQAYLKASNTGSFCAFGESVAVSGDTVIIGATGEDSRATGVDGDQADESVFDSGAAYVFVRSGGIWHQQAYLKASNTGDDDKFGCSVAISGNTIVVGALEESSSALGSGAAYVFVRSAGAWSQQAYLKAGNAGLFDYFGDSVAISGETIVVGAPGEDSNAVGMNGNQADNSFGDAGAAYVFVRIGGAWSHQAYLKASNTWAGEHFGDSVAISGETVVVGAYGEDSNAVGVNGNQANNSALNSGAAYVFVRSGGGWSQQAYLKASNTEAGEGFGFSVAASGETVVVGAIGEDSSAVGVNGTQANNNADSSGAAYVFVRSGGAWSQQAYLKASNTGAYDLFGYSVAISGETVVVGTNGEDSSARGVDGNQTNNNADGSGVAYVFARTGGSWSQQAYLKASNADSDDWFGYSVAVSDDTVIVGAIAEDGNATGVNGNQADNSIDQSGAAYIFTLNGPVEPPVKVRFKVRVKSISKRGKVTGAGIFTQGRTVTLMAKAKKGHEFLGWFENKQRISKKNKLVIRNLRANRSIVAKFK